MSYLQKTINALYCIYVGMIASTVAYLFGSKGCFWCGQKCLESAHEDRNGHVESGFKQRGCIGCSHVGRAAFVDAMHEVALKLQKTPMIPKPFVASNIKDSF